VVAEGIEDETRLELVSRLGAHPAQGYHLARPMTAEALHLLLSTQPLSATPDAHQPTAAVASSPAP